MCMCAYTHVATKNISLKDEAYLALKRLQLEGESFSDTILRISKKFGNLMSHYLNSPKYDDQEAIRELRDLKDKREKFSRGREY